MEMDDKADRIAVEILKIKEKHGLIGDRMQLFGSWVDRYANGEASAFEISEKFDMTAPDLYLLVTVDFDLPWRPISQKDLDDPVS